jgi:hypothetical protein
MAVTTVPTTSAGAASAGSSPLMPGAGTVDASPGTRPSTTMGAGVAARRASNSAAGSTDESKPEWPLPHVGHPLKCEG